MRGPSSYNGVRAGSLHSFGVPHFDQDSKHGHHPPLSEIQNYSVPGLIYTHQTAGSTQGNQGQYESASIYNDGIYLPYLHQDKSQVLFNQDGEDLDYNSFVSEESSDCESFYADSDFGDSIVSYNAKDFKKCSHD